MYIRCRKQVIPLSTIIKSRSKSVIKGRKTEIYDRLKFYKRPRTVFQKIDEEGGYV